MFISLHIPKTAGTALSTIFDFGCSRRIFYDYSSWDELRTPKLGFLERKTEEHEIRRSLATHKPFIEESFDFIHGHFFISKYLGFFENAKYITCVRKPIDRLLSHYLHLYDEADENYWLCRDIRSGQIDLVDFANLNFVGNLQCRLLEGISVSDLDYVFINEKLAESVYYFQLLFNFERNDKYMNLEGEQSIPRVNLNKNKMRKAQYIEPSVIQAAELALSQENSLYQEALAVFAKQSRRANLIG